MSSIIKTLRTNLNLTQKALAEQLNMPLNTLRNWEQSQRQPSQWMLDLIIHYALSNAQNQYINGPIDEENGILPFTFITQEVRKIAKIKPIEKVILFGSYAKGTAQPMSDVDIYIDSKLDDLEFFECAEQLRNALKKKVDLFSQRIIQPSSNLQKSIQTQGLLIYKKEPSIDT